MKNILSKLILTPFIYSLLFFPLQGFADSTDAFPKEEESFFTVNFQIEDEDGIAIDDAIITLNETENQPGEYVFEEIEAGINFYKIEKEGYLALEDELYLESDTTINIILELKPVTFPVTFNINMTDAIADGDIVFDKDIHEVYISGTVNGWITPGEDETYKLNPLETDKNNHLMYTVTLDLEEGIYEYKYYFVENEPNDGLTEWLGNNREIIVIGEQITEDEFGVYHFAGGTGSETNPWLIESAEQLSNIRLFSGEDYKGRYFRQINNINLNVAPYNEGEGWEPIGNSSKNFSGVYQGNGHIVDSLYINRPLSYYQGLFGFITDANISDLGVTNTEISGRWHIGGIAGLNIGSDISNCFSTGTITGEGNTGGLTGRNSGATIYNCYSISDVYADKYVGGLVGYNGASFITNSYSTGFVAGNEFVGGLVGYNDASVTDSYWNIESSGQSISAGGTGKNTRMLTLQDSYNQWDFENIWTITENETYPFFKWQLEPAAHNLLPERYEVTFNVDMTDAITDNGHVFNPETHSLYLAGTMTGWETPGQDDFYKLLPSDEKAGIFTVTLNIIEALQEYKYFFVENGPTWSFAEWSDDFSNRTIYINNDTIVNDIFNSYHASLSPATANFDLSNPQNVKTGLLWGEASEIKKISLKEAAISSSDYSVIITDDSATDTLALNKSLFADAKPKDKYTFTVEFDFGENANFTVNIINSYPSVNPEKEVFDLVNPADIETFIKWNGATEVVSILLEDAPVNQDNYHITDTDTLVLKQNLFDDAVHNDQYHFKIVFDYGDIVFIVTALNSNYPFINPIAIEYDKNSQEYIYTTITWNGATEITAITLTGDTISEENYFISETESNTDTLTFSHNLFDDVNSGDRLHFIINFDYGDPETFEINFYDSSYPSIDPVENCFDLKKPEEVYTIITWNGANEIKSIFIGNDLVDEDDYYLVETINQNAANTEVLFFKESLFNGSNDGDQIIFTISFDHGDALEFTVNVIESQILFIENTIPENDAIRVSIDADIIIVFNKNIQEGMMGNGFGDIVFEDENYNPWNIQDIYIENGDSLIIKPVLPLNYSSTYYLKLPYNAIAFADDFNVVMEDNFELTFTTKIEPSKDATLTDLTVDNETIEGFSPEKLDYSIEYPFGTSIIPEVGATSVNEDAVVDITQAIQLPGKATIIVTAQDEVTQLTYYVHFTLTEPGTDATLADINVNGQTIEEFDPDILNYSVILPYETTDMPVVGGTPNDDKASVDITQAPQLPGTATIEVTAEDGATKLTYSVEFKFIPQNDATLADLLIDGESINGFATDSFNYYIKLAHGTNFIPHVTATPNDENASVITTQAPDLPGIATVEVTAEDGVTILIYSVEFTLATKITEQLKQIKIFPNPASTQVSIVSENIIEYVTLIDITGKSVKEISVNDNHTEIFVNELQTGIYFIKIHTPEKIITERIQIIR